MSTGNITYNWMAHADSKYDEITNHCKALEPKPEPAPAPAPIPPKSTPTASQVFERKLENSNCVSLVRVFREHALMTKRLHNLLGSHDIHDIEDLKCYTRNEVSHWDMMGEVQLKNLEKIMADYHVHFAEPRNTVSQSSHRPETTELKKMHEKGVISTRLYNILVHRHDIRDLKDLKNYTYKEVSEWPKMGNALRNEIRALATLYCVHGVGFKR